MILHLLFKLINYILKIQDPIADFKAKEKEPCLDLFFEEFLRNGESESFII